MSTPFPERGQRRPDYWDQQLKDYIDESVEAVVDDLPDLVDEVASTQMAGLELAYAESTADFTTTNNVDLTTRVTGLAFNLTGTGRPVDIEFVCPNVYHSVANGIVVFFLVINDTPLSTLGTVATATTPGTTSGETVVMKRRLVIPDTTVYNVKVGMFLQTAGTGHAKGDPSGAMYLTATSR